MLHGLATSDFHLEGLKNIFPTDSTDRLITEIEKVFQYALSNGIQNIFIPGDISDTPQMDWSTYIKLVLLIKKYDDDINTYYIAGNHDFADIKKTSMDFLKVLENNGFFKNFHLYLQPETVIIDKQHINFLPFPVRSAPDSKVPSLNFAHVSVGGAIGDNGKRLKIDTDFECKSKHFTISGHIHQYQYLKSRQFIYCGNPYQKTFGETTRKGFVEFKAQAGKTMCVKHKFVPTNPEFRLLTLAIEESADIQKISSNKLHKYRVYVNPDVVLPKDFRMNYPNVVQLLSSSSKKKIELEDSVVYSEDLDINIIDPTDGLIELLLKECGLNKKQSKEARSYVSEAMSELGLS